MYASPSWWGLTSVRDRERMELSYLLISAVVSSLCLPPSLHFGQQAVILDPKSGGLAIIYAPGFELVISRLLYKDM